MCSEAIVDLYERHANAFDKDRGRSLQEKAWLDKFHFYGRRRHVVNDQKATPPMTYSRSNSLTLRTHGLENLWRAALAAYDVLP
jgi:hypothetical protein